MFFRDLLDLYVLRKCHGLPVPELWERAVEEYLRIIGEGRLTSREAKFVMDEALAYIGGESEEQARRDRDG